MAESLDLRQDHEKNRIKHLLLKRVAMHIVSRLFMSHAMSGTTELNSVLRVLSFSYTQFT